MGSADSKAMRCARINFFAVWGKKAPAFTVASLAMTMHGNAGDLADAGDGTGGGDAAPLLVHFVSRPKPDLEKIGAFIEQMSDAFAGREPTFGALPFLADFAASFAQDFLFAEDGLRIFREERCE